MIRHLIYKREGRRARGHICVLVTAREAASYAVALLLLNFEDQSSSTQSTTTTQQSIMATASRHLCRHLSRLSTRSSFKQQCQNLKRPIQSRCQPHRQISSTPSRFAKKEDSEEEEFLNNLQTPAKPYTVADLDPYERASYEMLSKEEQSRFLAIQNHFKAVTESEEIESLTEEQAEVVAKEVDRSGIVPNPTESRNLNALRQGMWQEDEDDEFGQTEDGDDDASEDLITSVAESEMEVQREIREYTRIAAWDLPLLLRECYPPEP